MLKLKPEFKSSTSSRWNLSLFANYCLRLAIFTFLGPNALLALPLESSGVCSRSLTNNPKLLEQARRVVFEGHEFPLNQVSQFSEYRQMFLGFKDKAALPAEPGSREIELFEFLEENRSRLNKLVTPPQIIEYSPLKTVVDPRLKGLVDSVKTGNKKLSGKLLKIDENLGYWMELLGESSEQVLSWKSDKGSFLEFLEKEFLTHRNRVLIGKAKSSGENFEASESLFSALMSRRARVIAGGGDTSRISRAVLDLFSLFSYRSDPYISFVFNNDDPYRWLVGLGRLIDARSKLVLSIAGRSFEHLAKSLEVDQARLQFPFLERRIKEMREGHPVRSLPVDTPEKLVVRQLTVQEAPFRSELVPANHSEMCCATEAYFFKSLDPNYLYFTITDQNLRSYGHVVVVLGSALGLLGPRKVGFIDKVQNVPLDLIHPVLTAVRDSLMTVGYKLVIARNLGYGDNYISNSIPISTIMRDEILKHHSGRKYLRFVPHRHGGFTGLPVEDAYTRAEQKLNVVEFLP